MSDQNLADSSWEDCPEGKIRHFAARLNARQRRSPVRWSYVATLMVLSGILAVRLTEASQTELKIGGITCTELMARVDDYINGDIKGEMASQMGFHLSNCPHCARQVRGIAKKDVLSRLFGTNDFVYHDGAALSQPAKRKWCDDPAPKRTPVVAQKVLAVAEE
jgi:hypothetical protein